MAFAACVAATCAVGATARAAAVQFGTPSQASVAPGETADCTFDVPSVKVDGAGFLGWSGDCAGTNSVTSQYPDDVSSTGTALVYRKKRQGSSPGRFRLIAPSGGPGTLKVTPDKQEANSDSIRRTALVQYDDGSGTSYTPVVFDFLGEAAPGVTIDPSSTVTFGSDGISYDLALDFPAGWDPAATAFTWTLSAQAVPEPTWAGAGVLAGLGLLRRARRR